MRGEYSDIMKMIKINDKISLRASSIVAVRLSAFTQTVHVILDDGSQHEVKVGYRETIHGAEARIIKELEYTPVA